MSESDVSCGNEFILKESGGSRDENCLKMTHCHQEGLYHRKRDQHLRGQGRFCEQEVN